MVKIGKHAWNVYPLEAFGYLLGRCQENTVYAALPCSKTGNWYEFEDRWHGIEQAVATAQSFDLSVVGCYSSCEAFDISDYPLPPVMEKASLNLRALYHTFCCPGHSWASIFLEDNRLIRGEDYLISPGKRSGNHINQKRILQKWCKLHGSINYANKPSSIDLSTSIG